MIIKILPQVIISAFILFSSLSSFALDNNDSIKAGKAKAITCVGCHGVNGIAVAPNFPNLAGQKKLYLKNAILSYQNGTRNDPTMKAMVGALNKTDIANLAAYFSSLPGK